MLKVRCVLVIKVLEKKYRIAVQNFFKVLLDVLNQEQVFSLYIQKLKTIKVSFADVFRGQNARSKVHLSDLGVGKEVANICLPFSGCKAKNTIPAMY